MAVQSKQVNRGWWAAYVAMLAARPVLTKAATSAFLNTLQETISQVMTNPRQDRGIVLEKALKMGTYGFTIGGPLGHFLYAILNGVFSGTSLGHQIGQLVGANVFVVPIQNAVYLAAMALISGGDVVAEVKRGFWPLMKLTWSIFPVVQLIAIKFLRPDLWLPFFQAVGFVFGVYVSYQVKNAQRRRRLSDGGKRRSQPRSS
ncbi:hypothetical protein GGF31_004814 [Allomyces arbusculus]|nr:hypothetical protein GGF31_004814 [Allomyces arbusculus]